MKKQCLSILIAGAMTIGSIGLTHAATINYTSTDLVDINSGEDLWQYSYTVTNNTFAADTGFTIYFDLGLYDLLDPSPSAPNADWDVLTWDPDPSLPDDGAYDAYALVNNASLSDTFTVNFVWLGVATTGPGSQYFELYDGITWSIFEDGFTSSGASTDSNSGSVPEPQTLILLAIGLTGLATSCTRKPKKY